MLPLVPPYLVYLTGTSLEQLAADAEPAEPRVKRETLAAALLFVLGFSTVFVALGASASAIGAVLRALGRVRYSRHRGRGYLMGLHFLGLTPIALLMREKRLEDAESERLFGRRISMGLSSRSAGRRASGRSSSHHLPSRRRRGFPRRAPALLHRISLGLGIPFIIRPALAVEPFAAFLARFHAISASSKEAMGGFWCSPACTARRRMRADLALRYISMWEDWVGAGVTARRWAFTPIFNGYSDEAIPRVSRKLDCFGTGCTWPMTASSRLIINSSSA